MTNTKQIGSASFVMFILILSGSGLVANHAFATGTAPTLGAASTFGVLANTYTNSGTGTSIIGNLGYTVPPASTPIVSGTTFIATNATYIAAEAAQASAISFLNDPTQSGNCTTTITPATVLDTLQQPLQPGIYCITGAVSINNAITLNGSGVYIFRIGGALNTVANSVVTLTNGTQAGNVFWVPVGATTLGASSLFAGNILSNAAFTLGSNASMTGRILSDGAVTTNGLDTITVPGVLSTPPPSPDFSLSATSVTISQGSIGTSTMTITPSNGFSSPVTFSLSGNPSGVTGTFSPNPSSSTSTLTLTVGSTVPAGSSTLTVSGTSGSLTHATTFSLVVTAPVTPPSATPGVIILSDQLSCQTLGGNWTSVTSTCTVGTLVIGPVNTLAISKNVVFSIGTVTSSGVIANYGTILIASGGVITTSGTVSNNGIITSSGGTITNSGPFANFGTITSSGTITNGPTGTITSNGTITSTGVITSSGTIIISKGGALYNNHGVLTNSLNIINSGTIYSSGTFTNSGPVMNIGDIINQGLLTNSNTITNFGTMTNLCGGSITNSGTIAIHLVIDGCVVPK